VPPAQYVSPGKRGRKDSRAQEATSDSVDAQALVGRTLVGLSTAATRGYMTDETIDHLRETCPGWDLYALHADFECWVNADSERTPADWQRAFIGWVKRHHEKHRNQLRG